MGKGSRRLPLFCSRRVSTRVRVRSPWVGTKPISNTVELVSRKKNESGCGEVGKRIMVVVDPTREAKAALQWALSQAVQGHYMIVLLDVVKPSSKQGEKSESYELLHAMRKFCQSRKPEIQVELSLVEGKERGPTIVSESRRQGVSLLVLGQRKRSVTWRLLRVWAGGRSSGGGIVEYCIQNASCMTLAVRRKGRTSGGYLITSRLHKDFWLLA